ncbi:MAG: glycosyltransferase family 39 protein [Planctomycetes bacterium]|nr:glycosyltransferase family 39 protein [Planctomycetota bacterium]
MSSPDLKETTPEEAPPSLPGESLSGLDWVLLLMGTIPFFLALGGHSAYQAEGRSLGIAMSMREKGTWLSPDMFGEFYGFRPLLYFWCVTIASYVTGGVTELAGRLPAALSGAASVVLTGHLAARLFGRRTAVPAGWILATTHTMWLWSRLAAMDTMNLAFTTAAIAVYVESIGGFRRWHAFAFAILLGLGANAKGIPALVLPCAVGFADAVLHRRKDLLRNAKWFAAAVPLCLLIFMMSFLMSYAVRHNWELLRVWYIENIQRIYDPYDHHDNPWPYYFWVLPGLFMPWGLLLPVAVARACTTGTPLETTGGMSGLKRLFARFFNFVRTSDRGRIFVATAAAVIFATFTASASRRSYYIMPVFPWCALLVAAAFEALAKERKAWTGWRWATEGPLFLIFAILPIVGLVLLAAPWIPGNPGKALGFLPKAPLGGLACIAASAAFWITRRREGRLQVTAAGGLLLVFAYASAFGDSGRDRLYPERPFCQAVLARHPGEAFVYYHVQNTRIYYHLGERRDTTKLEFDTPEQLAAILATSGGTSLVLADGRYREQIEKSPLFETTVDLESTTPEIPYRRKSKTEFVLYRVRLR